MSLQIGVASFEQASKVIEYSRPGLRPCMSHSFGVCPVDQLEITSFSLKAFANAVYSTLDPLSPATRIKFTFMLTAVASTKPGVLGAEKDEKRYVEKYD